MRFPMTLSAAVKVTTALAVLALAVGLPIQARALTALPAAASGLVAGVLLVTVLGLGVVALQAPRAVRLEATRLVVERRGWSDVKVPYFAVTGVERGPALELLGGAVRRVAGNGGLLGFTGLFHVRDVGLVRCWATRLGRPTVLVRRGKDRPLLLGVDEPERLFEELRRRAG
ncbi:MAG: PH domain-containing protein [Myxococcota bacterium]